MQDLENTNANGVSKVMLVSSRSVSNQSYPLETPMSFSQYPEKSVLNLRKTVTPSAIFQGGDSQVNDELKLRERVQFNNNPYGTSTIRSENGVYLLPGPSLLSTNSLNSPITYTGSVVGKVIGGEEKVSGGGLVHKITPNFDFSVPGPRVEVMAPRVEVGPARIEMDQSPLIIQGPQVDLEGPEIKVGPAEVKLGAPKLTLEQVNVSLPDIQVPAHKINVSGAVIEVPSAVVERKDRVELGKFEIQAPGQSVLVPEPIVVARPTEISIDNQNVEVPLPRINVRMPRVNVPPTVVNIQRPNVLNADKIIKVPSAEIKIESPKVQVERPNVSVEGSKMKLERIDVPGPLIDVEGPSVRLAPPAVEVSASRVEGPSIFNVQQPGVTLTGQKIKESDPRVTVGEIKLNSLGESTIQPLRINVAPTRVTVPATEVELPKAIEVALPDINLPQDVYDIRTPDLRIEPALVRSVANMTVSSPKMIVPAQNIKITSPSLRLSPSKVQVQNSRIQTPDIQIPGQKINVRAPDVRLPPPIIKVSPPQVSQPSDLLLNPQTLNINSIVLNQRPPNVGYSSSSIDIISPSIILPSNRVSFSKSPPIFSFGSEINLSQPKVTFDSSALNVQTNQLKINGSSLSTAQSSILGT